ncbi:MAG: hypothetical protein IJG13_08880 [Kiritimatiellae bacterium]|nr:hypothetical protein [Kiritimatiellia bacterium]
MAKDITTRKHPLYAARFQQIVRNRLAIDGGRPYIEARLQRAPNETDVSWEGTDDGVVGRKDRACLVNDAGRIAQKINQYLFKAPATRKGADDSFVSNCDGSGKSVAQFMEDVSTAITAAGWCWLQVDRNPQEFDEAGNPIGYTLETARENPVKWRLWEALDVTDWHIDDDGDIRWLLTRSFKRVDGNPYKEGKDVEIYTLYHKEEDGRVYVTEKAMKTADGLVLRQRVAIPGLEKVPFVLVGRISGRPWWFDDVENIQCQILNLDSLHNETLTNGVYPQLVVPYSLLQSLDVDLKLEKVGQKERVKVQRELIKGRSNPLFEDAEDRGTTRYIQPNAGDLSQIVNEANRKRGLLFDMAGLSLFNKETRQIQTAESKQFDQLDTNSTLGNRALLLQTAERQLVEMSAMFDGVFAKYDPVYPTKFDVIDTEALSSTLQTIGNLPDIPPKMKKMILRAALRIVRETGGCDDGDYDEALKEIDALSDEQLTGRLPDLFNRDEGGNA